MTMSQELKYHKVDINDFVEIELDGDDKFLLVRETLERIGVPSTKDGQKRLYPSCHILHKQGRYFVVHFKEMFSLDGKPTNFSDQDMARRNTIANLLREWGLVKLVDENKSKDPVVHPKKIKILSFKEKPEWEICPKYNIGTKKKRVTDTSQVS